MTAFPDTTGRRSELVIDLSYYQQPSYINYDLLSQQVKGVILRAGYTGKMTGNTYYQDTAFETHYREFRRRGVPVGAYWYSCATTPEQGRAEAYAFMNVVGNRSFDLPVYWDTEDSDHQAKVTPRELTDAGLAFVNTLRSNGYNAGVYGSSWWLGNRLYMGEFSGPVWVAHYGVSCPSYRGYYGMWQFTSKYHLPGYGGNLDASRRFLD